MPATAFPDLTTDRLRLRTLAHEDAPDLLALYGAPDVMRYWSHAPWTALVQALGAVDEAHADLAAGRALHLAIALRAGGQLAGSCALFDIDHCRRSAMLGYLLAPPFWGQGLAREALRALTGHGFAALGLERIEAEVDPANAASRALLARLGFRREGTLPGHWCVAGMARDVERWVLAGAPAQS